MEAILKFDLDNPDDRMAHLRCVKSLDMALVLFSITHNIKDSADKTGEEVMKEIYDVLEEQGVNIDELII